MASNSEGSNNITHNNLKMRRIGQAYLWLRLKNNSVPVRCFYLNKNVTQIMPFWVKQYVRSIFNVSIIYFIVFKSCYLSKNLMIDFRFRSSFIYQRTSTRRQRRDLFGLRDKLPPDTTSLITQR